MINNIYHIMKHQRKRLKAFRHLPLLLLWLWALWNPAYAQKSVYHVGDIYTFPDSTKGVVCYVNPYNPQEGWAVDIRDVPERESALTEPGKFNLSYGDPLTMPIYPNVGRLYDAVDCHINGRDDTRQLHDSIESSAMRNSYLLRHYYSGWYIPDITQLRQFYSLIPIIGDSIVAAGGELPPSSSELYWSSTRRSAKQMWVMYMSSGHIVPPNETPAITDEKCMIRMVREFRVGGATAYWQEGLLEHDSSEFITVHVNSDSTFHAMVVYGDSLFGPFETHVYQHPSYRFEVDDNRPEYYDTVCQVRNGAYKNNAFPFNGVFNGISINQPTPPNADPIEERLLRTETYYCDSLVRLHLRIDPIYDFYDTVEVCESELPIVWHDSTYSKAGDYFIKYKTVSVCKCDSIWHLNLKVVPKPELSVSPDPQSVCMGSNTRYQAIAMNQSLLHLKPLAEETFAKVTKGNGNMFTDAEIKSQAPLFVDQDSVFGIKLSGDLSGIKAVRIGQFVNPKAYYGYLTTKDLTLPDGPFSVHLSMMGWTNADVPTCVQVEVGDQKVLDTVPGGVTVDEFRDYIFHFNKVTSPASITIRTLYDADMAENYPYMEERVIISHVWVHPDEPSTIEWFEYDPETGDENPVAGTPQTPGTEPGTQYSIYNIYDVQDTAYYIAQATSHEVERLTYHKAACVTRDTVRLDVIKPVRKDTVVKDCNSITWKGNIIEVSTDDMPSPPPPDTLRSSKGCDSLILTLKYTRLEATKDTVPMTACDTFSTEQWPAVPAARPIVVNKGGFNEGVPKVVPYSITYEPEGRCDSIVWPELTMYASKHEKDTVAVCREYTWMDGETYYPQSDTTFVYRYEDAHGCKNDSTVRVKVYDPKMQVSGEPITVCEGDDIHLSVSTVVSGLPDEYVPLFTFLWTGPNGFISYSADTTIENATLSDADTYSVTVTLDVPSIGLCQEIVTVDVEVAVNRKYSVRFDTVVCQSELPLNWRGATFNEAGIIVQNLQTVQGCDSIVTLILTVNPVDSIHFDEETVCAGGEYAAHGFNYTAEYTTTGYVHYDTIRTQNENGCDSIVT